MVSLAHTALMVALRIAAFALGGDAYAPVEAWPDRLLFEARKDAITYVSLLAVFLLARQLAVRPVPGPPHSSAETLFIEVREDSRAVLLRPEEIDRVSAKGICVELHGSFGSKPARRTMADMKAPSLRLTASSGSIARISRGGRRSPPPRRGRAGISTSLCARAQ